MERRVVFTGKNQVGLEPFEPATVAAGMVGVRAASSLMSTGTENIVLQRLFEPGSHWDKWVQYPFYPGYAMIGRVDKVGAGVETPRPGQVVALRRGHASYHVLPAEQCSPVPEGIALPDAAWFALGKITFMGARAAQYGLGDSVLVIGAGPIGQLSVRWARAAGVETIIVADRFEQRLALARRGGATTALGKPIEEAEADIKAANAGELPRVVLDSTGNASVFAHALKLAAPRGRVVVLGDTGTPTQQSLTSDVIMRGLSIVGAHDGHEDAVWTGARIHRLFFNLVKTNRFDLSGLNTHGFRPEECVKAYETANTRRAETMGIIFDWSADR